MSYRIRLIDTKTSKPTGNAVGFAFITQYFFKKLLVYLIDNVLKCCTIKNRKVIFMEIPQQPARLVRTWVERKFPFTKKTIEVEVIEIPLPTDDSTTNARIIIRENGVVKLDQKSSWPLLPGEEFLPMHALNFAQQTPDMESRWIQALKTFCSLCPNFRIHQA